MRAEYGSYVLDEPATKRDGARLARHNGSDVLVEIERVDDAAAERLAKLTQLRHAKLVSVLELGANEGGRYVVTEHVRGATFAELLARETETRVRYIIPVAIDALYGLAALHAHGVVHGCVEPSSIVVGADGVARITSVERPSADDAVLYLAPEQVQDGAAVDHRADVFALGVILWNALTGKELYRLENGATAATALHRAVPRPSGVGAQPPAILDAVVLKALERDPAKRFDGAEAMAHALRDVAMKMACLGAPAEIGAWVAPLPLPAPPILPTVVDPAAPSIHSAQTRVAASMPMMLPTAPSSRRVLIASLACGAVIASVLAWQWAATSTDGAPQAAAAAAASAPAARRLEVTLLDVRDVPPPPAAQEPAAVTRPAKPPPATTPVAPPPATKPAAPPQIRWQPAPVARPRPPATPEVRTTPPATAEKPKSPTTPATTTKPDSSVIENNPYVYK